MAGTTTTPAPAQANRPANADAVRRYFRESWVELTKKVSWPSREQTTNLTIVVVVVCVAISLFLGGVDYLFASLIKALGKVGVGEAHRGR